ncbi:L,D-transpeptidase family protein [Qipengyuania mesophila]|uniref:L,D-transpeptidase family protein n=1 Tax=Qipengyuania mesophila TaxID=2867246 RepID=A0ABS7JQE5_9SPHN|nr:L,D-transpeptidase family protein [Qipengyuania mesophila]MBX7499849.1 L,D-transpeptidase family protein [Qipengyuania mesophila]
MKRATLLMAVGLAALGVTAAQAQPVDRGDRPILEVVTALETGEFVWAPELSPQGPMLLVVNLASQRAVLFRNGVPIAASTVSTGREGYETPTGVFTILQKRKEHYSNLYDDAPMPNMQRLTWGGVALHAGNLPGYPASHGCIRLPMAFSALLFDTTSLGMTVVITDVPAAPQVSAAPGVAVVGGAAGKQSIEAASFEWHPERVTSGVVSVVVSVADQRAVVLRSGIEIGSAPVRVDGALAGPIAYVLSAADESGRQWLKLDLAGSGEGSEIGADEADRFLAPTAFRSAVNDILKPGTVVIVTPQSLAAASAGENVTVIEAGES